MPLKIPYTDIEISLPFSWPSWFRSTSTPSIAQGVVTTKLELWLKKKGRKLKLSDGYCHGIAVYWAYKKSLGQESEVDKILLSISTWDGKEDRDVDFEKLLNNIEWLQRGSSYAYGKSDNYDQNHIPEKIEVVRDASHPPLQCEFSIAFTFEKSEIYELLKETIKDKKIIVLGSYDHEVSVWFEDGKYLFRDSNGDQGSVEYYSLKSFIDGLIENLKFNNNNSDKIVLGLNVYDHYGKQPATYFNVVAEQTPVGKENIELAKEQWIKDLLKKREQKTNSNGINDRAWNGTNAILVSARFNHPKLVEIAIDAGGDVNFMEPEYKITPLWYAVCDNDLDRFKKLLQSGANVKSLTSEGISPLSKIISLNHTEMLEALIIHLVEQGNVSDLKEIIELYPEINKNVRIHSNLLHHAAEKGHDDMVKYLVNHGCEIETQDINGKTALDIASAQGHLQIIQFLSVQLFVKAAERGDLVCVKFLLAQGVDINSVNVQGICALHAALAKENALIIDYLLQNNCDPNAVNPINGETALHIAATKSHALTQLLIKSGAKITVRNKINDTPLHYSAKSDVPAEVMEIFVAQGIPVDAINNWERTALHTAVMEQKLEQVKTLIGLKAAINAQDDSGETALHYAAKHTTDDLLNYLIKHKADIHIKNFHGITPLHYAAESQNFNGAKMLMNEGADVTAVTANGETVLHFAARSGALDIVKEILSHNMSLLTIPSHTGDTPVHVASSYDHEEIIKIFINQHDNVNVENNARLTPLHYATLRGQLRAVHCLIRAGANVDAMDSEGNTSLHYAVEYESFEIAEVLIASKANLQVTNAQGDTPLALAIKNNNFSSILRLLENGARFDFQSKASKQLLYAAIKHNHFDLIKYLIMMNPEFIHKKNSKGLTLSEIAQIHNHIGLSIYFKNIKIFNYAKKGNIDKLKKWVYQDFYVNEKNDDGSGLIHIAIENEDLPLLKYLLTLKGLDINLKDRRGLTALHRAVSKRNIAMVDILVKHGSDLESKDEQGVAVLEKIIISHDTELLKHIIEETLDLNIKKSQYKKMLATAEECENKEIKRYLSFLEIIDIIKNNNIPALIEFLGTHDINCKIRDLTVFQWALRFNKLKIAEYLLAAKVSLDNLTQSEVDLLPTGMQKQIAAFRTHPNTTSLLHAAAKYNDEEIVELLVQQQLLIDAVDYQGQTALHIASECNHFEIVRFLIEKNAKPNIKDNGDQTPLHLAVKNKNHEVIKLLIASGVDLFSRNYYQNTPLEIALENQDDDTVNLLAKFYVASISNTLIDKMTSKNDPGFSESIRKLTDIKNQERSDRESLSELKSLLNEVELKLFKTNSRYFGFSSSFFAPQNDVQIFIQDCIQLCTQVEQDYQSTFMY